MPLEADRGSGGSVHGRRWLRSRSLHFGRDDRFVRVWRRAVGFANTHLSDDETVAKMGHPELWVGHPIGG